MAGKKRDGGSVKVKITDDGSLKNLGKNAKKAGKDVGSVAKNVQESDRRLKSLSQQTSNSTKAFSIHDMLPDRWDGMSGSYFGKDLSALGTILDIYEVEDKKQCVFWLKNIEALNSRSINDRMTQERKRKK